MKDPAYTVVQSDENRHSTLGRVVVRKGASFIRVLVPLTFDTHDFGAVAAAINRVILTDDNGVTSNVWERRQFTSDRLLPHVSKYVSVEPEDATVATLVTWRMAGRIRTSRQFGLGTNHNWVLLHGGSSPEEIPFLLRNVYLSLFRTGFGFVTYEVAATEGEIANWGTLLHLLGRSWWGNPVLLSARRRADAESIETSVPPLIRAFQKGDDQRRTWSLRDATCALLDTTLDVGSKAWWNSPYRSLNIMQYAHFITDDLASETTADILERAQNGFSFHDDVLASHVGNTANPYIKEFLPGYWNAVSMSRCVFVSNHDKRSKHLFNEIRSCVVGEFYLAFLIVLHQRLFLLAASDIVADGWFQDEGAYEAGRELILEELHKSQLEFTARGMFVQVMSRLWEHELYRCWQHAFLIGELLEEVQSEVREMSDYLSAQRDKALERTYRSIEAKLQYIGIPLAVFGIALTAMDSVEVSRKTLLWTAVALVLQRHLIGWGPTAVVGASGLGLPLAAPVRPG